MNAATTVLAVVVAYFMGTIPSAIVIARSKGVDITTFGSGNPGATNVGRALGTKYFVICMLMDAGKSFVPTVAMVGDRHVAYMCGAAAIVGHIFPVTRKLKGGKGIAAGAGVLLAVQPVAALAAFAAWLLLSRTTGKSSIGSIAAVPVAVAALALSGVPAWEVWSMVGIGLLVEIRHIGNIKRLLSGSENRMSDTPS
mgnify:FL=1